jgi:hypothetical protein
MKKQLFLVGFPRSGTTLIRSRISQHPDIHLINEPEIIYGLRHAGFDTNNQIRLTKEVLQNLGEIGHCRNHLEKLSSDFIESILGVEEPLSFKQAYESLLPIPQGLDVWGEKSLNNAFFTREISQLYPDALVINIVRDARSCLWSKYQKNKIREQNQNSDLDQPHKSLQIPEVIFFAKHAAFWAAWQQTTKLQLTKYIDQPNLINLRYEDFIDQPETYLKIICGKLGLSYHEDMIDYNQERRDPVLLSKAAYAHQNITRKIDRSKINSYLDMPSAMIWVIESFAGKEMRKYDYRLSNPSLPVIDKLFLKTVLIKNAKNIRRYVNKKMRARFVDPDAVN